MRHAPKLRLCIDTYNNGYILIQSISVTQFKIMSYLKYLSLTHHLYTISNKHTTLKNVIL